MNNKCTTVSYLVVAEQASRRKGASCAQGEQVSVNSLTYTTSVALRITEEEQV